MADIHARMLARPSFVVMRIKKNGITPIFPKKSARLRAGKKRKREKIGNEGKKGKKSTRVRKFSSTVSRVVYMYYGR